ncbi:PQQ-binding-like beta-propeller repeat protein [Nocardia cyriacigeorgica]|uniref:outer membrane protein assembly factor BamB family protein n=1 Tax=Nocardia cyriacigeorgica TaxID=135487 RepID=UPI0013B797F5|nr:PQQ-binding-like beta-propeller repeat protein [Nocardia cyriacigeorgica]NEW52421.1 PQQ-binding-like beta-propeller repeat protein [Nocardia cyriacigeorgica]
MTPGIRNLVLAAVAAVVTSAGAVAVLTQPDDTTRKITGTNDAAPGLAWSIDAAATYGEAFAEFRDPAFGTEYDLGGAGVMDAGDTLIAVIGVADDGMSLREPRMYGFDTDTGEKRWQAPAADLSGCADAPVDGMLVCYTSVSAEDPALIGYDIDTGAITRTPSDWMVFAIAAVDDRLYVAEGDVESDDVRVHSGTLSDPEVHWSRSFAMGTAWESLSPDALDVSHGQGIFTLGPDLASFDLVTGEPTFTAALEGCSRTTATSDALLHRVHTECDGYRVTSTDILDRTGRVLATTDRPGVHDLALDEPADDAVPVVMADTAYDRRDGTVRWTSPDLIYTSDDTGEGPTTRGAATAILGDIALLQDHTAHTMSGLDLRTGQRLWRTESDGYPPVRAWDSRVAVLTDPTGFRAIDPRTGETAWTTPFRAINTDPDALTDNGELIARSPGHFVFAAPRTMIALHPLD